MNVTDISTSTPRRTLTPWLLLLALVVIAGGLWTFANRVAPTATTTDLPPAPVKGHPAPDIRLLSTTGEAMNLSDLQGQPVIINFWATWCGPCRIETPELQAVHRELGDQVVIFSVNVTAQDNGDIPGFLEEFGVTFPVALDPDAVAYSDYNVLGLPTTVFINKEGIVHEVFTGPVNKAYLESKIPELS
jgi:thiol-disulfide isomerase/thioredoxin